ncbi:MAG: sulfite exporter TauE/SafE family protein [Pseudomonadota bacterium]
MDEVGALQWGIAVGVALLAGFVKGVVGFAMPMIMISGLGSVMRPELALAALVMPTLATNAFQALRGGWRDALASARRNARFILIMLATIAGSAQLINVLSTRALFLIIGVPVVVFALIQLFGVRFSVPAGRRGVAEVVVGVVAGFIGGLSGVWGPPTVLYLTALDTLKAEQMRVQGIVYGLGAVMLTVAHIKSGVVNSGTALPSAALVVPAVLGVLVGFRLSDRLDQALFRKATLVVLVVAGLNLVRRGLLS